MVTTTDTTDIEVVVEAVVGGTTKLLQCKYGPSHWRSVEHAKRWATEWATKTRGAVAGERWVVVPDVIELDAELVRGVAKCGVRGVAKVSDLSNVLAP
ncbi:MAG: hypothetical protein HUU35_12775 [Armatimonadetes bacterium]|nr:hypothetical protein [Armatimonadota bacterium]